MGNTPSGKRRNSESDDRVEHGLGHSGDVGSQLPPRKKFIMQPSQENQSGDAIMRILGDSGVADVTARLQSACLNDFISSGRGTISGNTSGTSTPRQGCSPTQGCVPLSKPMPRTLPTVFKWEGDGKDIYLSGSFNNWSAKIPMVKSSQNFYTILDLPEGEHRYKFIVDGHWRMDPHQEIAPVIDHEEEKQNVIFVRSTDFDVTEALLQDIAHSKHPDNRSGSRSQEYPRRAGSVGSSNVAMRDAVAPTTVLDRIRSNSPPGDYTQEIPDPHDHSKMGAVSHKEKSNAPPLLPPHLLQVIINKTSGNHDDPTLMPSPNHVMVNHMYALQIKEGVIVLSDITRYRRKVVSTVVYKPI